MSIEFDHNHQAESTGRRRDPPRGAGAAAWRDALAWQRACGIGLLLFAVAGCSFGITNQPGAPGGCVGEPARVHC